ncbi:MAG: class I SAM-dependent methyltransferase [Solirubrobacteraceae bacterium]
MLAILRAPAAPRSTGWQPARERLVTESTADLGHPLFARLFDRLSPMMERELRPLRQELIGGLRGRVLEVGAGNGLNFAHYPEDVSEVIALEPEPYLRARAELAAAAAPVPVTVLGGRAETVPAPAGSFDAAVASLVLCSVSVLPQALAELRRVLRGGGELRFFEHVCSDRPGKARAQRLLDRSGAWPLVAGGCHCGRATVAAITAAGFRIEQHRHLDLGPAWLHANPYVIGRAQAASER